MLWLSAGTIHMAKPRTSTAKNSRREEYAEATRQAIIVAARKLFSLRGYFATRVDEIAAEARVAPATVYAVSGGKQGLLQTLMDLWTTAPIVEKTVKGSEALSDPREILRLCARTLCSMRQEYGDIIRVILNTAPHDATIARTLATATDRYRKALVRIGRHIASLGGLRKGIDENEVADILWFYYGYWALFTLIDDNKWTYDRAEKWIAEEAARALLKNR